MGRSNCKHIVNTTMLSCLTTVISHSYSAISPKQAKHPKVILCTMQLDLCILCSTPVVGGQYLGVSIDSSVCNLEDSVKRQRGWEICVSLSTYVLKLLFYIIMHIFA